MGLLVKDRFRFNESTESVSPSSVTCGELLKCTSCVHGQLKFFTQYKMTKSSGLFGCWINTTFSRFKTLLVFTSNMMLHKRHQFLTSATWEQYFVLTSADIQFILLSFQQSASIWKALLNLDDSKSLLWIERNLLFLEVIVDSFRV